VYTYPPALVTEAPEIGQPHAISNENGADMTDVIEAQAQAILGELEQLAPEIQLAIYTRLLNGLSIKLTSGVVTIPLVRRSARQRHPAAYR